MLAAIQCTNCGAAVPAYAKDCVECEEPVGFPNVRAAKAADETDALARRVKDAFVSAKASGFESELKEFGEAVAGSKAVMARDLAMLDAFVGRDNHLLQSFHKMVRAGERLPEENMWDKGRAAAESTIHPQYFEEIQYAALSLDGFGLTWFGDFHISFKDAYISRRASVFEENPFVFCNRKNVVAGAQPPPGYRAPWDNRGELAQAKLFPKIRKGMTDGDFPGVLVFQGADPKTADCIEVHIYGGIHYKAIESVIASKDAIKDKASKHIWRRVKRRLDAIGVKVQVI